MAAIIRIKRSDLATSQIKVEFDDPRLERALSPEVTSFKLRIGPSNAGSSKSNSFTKTQQSKIRKAPKGTQVLIYDIKYILYEYENKIEICGHDNSFYSNIIFSGNYTVMTLFTFKP